MSRTLYLECTSGISGDMFVAALLGLGAERQVLEQALHSLPVQGFSTKISQVEKSGIMAWDFAVQLEAEYDNHDHDMEYLHGTSGKEKQTHPDGEHFHRGLTDIYEILDKAELSENARETAKRIFSVLAKAEGRVHGVPEEKVHFHEVGAIDSIVDITAAAVCLDNLSITKVIVPGLTEGQGTVRCQHGILPIPVPAVAAIVAEYEIPLRIAEVQGEFVTPTGAAIVAAIRTDGQLPKQFRIQRIGIGAGKRTYESPGILRAMLIEEEIKAEEDVIYKLETNIDDCSGEVLGYVMERLLEAGARDVHYMPVYMKKNRPAYQLNVICTKEKIRDLEKIIFEETTTIGIRRQRMERSVLQREVQTVMTEFGEAQVKVCTIGDKRYFYPEYESVRKICESQGKSYNEIYQMIQRACQ